MAKDRSEMSLKEDTTELRRVNERLRLELDERKRMEAELKARARQQAAVAELGQRALAGTNLSIVMDEVVSLVVQTLAVEYSEIFELSPDGDTLLLRAGAGWQDGLVGQATVGSNSDSLAGYALFSGEPVIVEDLAKETRFKQSSLLRDHRVVSSMSIVIQGEDRPFGLLGAHTINRRTFTEDDIHFLQAIANTLAMAIERRQAETQTAQRNRALLTLQSAGAAIASSLDLQYVLNTVTREMVNLLEVEACAISDWNQAADTLSLLAQYGPEDWCNEALADKVYDLADYPLTKQVLVERQTQQMTISQPDIDPAELAYIQEAEIVSLLILPMVFQDRVVGLAELEDSRVERTFTEPEISLAQLLANQAAIAIENARLFEQTQIALEKTAMLYRAARALARMDNEQQMFELVLADYLQHLNLRQGGVLVIGDDKTYGTLKAHIVAGKLVEPGFRIPVAGNPSYDRLIETREPVVIRDALHDKLLEPVRELTLELGIKSLLLVPIVVRGEVIGALGADATEAIYEFTDREISLVKAMANQLGIAIENFRLYAETQRRAEHLAVLHELDLAITARLSLNDIYYIFARHAARLLSYDRLSITLLEGDKLRATYVAGKGEEKNMLPVGVTLPLKGSALGRVVAQGQPLLRHNLAADARFPEEKSLVASGIQSTMLIPLRVKGEITGTWNIGSRRVGAYNPDDLEIAQALADHLASAIENARLYVEIEQHLEELTTLNMISQIITSTLDLQEMLTIITGHTIQLLDVAATSVALYDEANGDLWFAAASGGSSDFVRGRRLPMGQGVIGWVVEHGEPVLVPEASKDPRFLDQFDQESGFTTHSILCVPLRPKGQTIGAIEALNKEGSFDENDLRQLSSLAASAAAAIENARLFKQAQQEIAERKRAEEALQSSIQQLEMANKQAMIYAQELREEIIERKRAEAALEEERALLAQRVAERTADLSAANEELARAARLKDEFLASMSHELRTPLSAILGLAEVLKGEIYGPLSEKQLRSLNNIEESGRHLLALINDILDLSKIGAGKLELQIGYVPVEAVCQASLRLIKEAAHKKQIKVSSTLDNTVTILQADERRLKQILVNLLSNAVKFTPDGGGIGLEVVGDVARQEVDFTVWDTGIGIPPEDRARLFRPFVQLDSRLSRQFPGTGLGLTLVQRMAELHNGRLSVESEVGQGSRFTVSLPWLGLTRSGEAVEQAELAASTESEEPDIEELPIAEDALAIVPDRTGQQPAPLPAKPPLILLVEDDKNMATFMTNYLQIKEYRVIVAWNGIEAIERAREEKPDVILMDIQLPQMDGLEATRRIRADAERSLATIPIVALTALAMPGDRERCLEAGTNAYLSKPIKLTELVEAIEAQLNRNRITEEGLP